MNPPPSESVWSVVSERRRHYPQCGVLPIWADSREPGGVGIQTLGTPPKWLVEKDGLYLAHRHLTSAQEARLNRPGRDR